MNKDILREVLYYEQLSSTLIVFVLLTAFIPGAIHALSPGHGKSLMAAYLIGTKGRIRDAIILALTLTISHIFIVLVVGFIALFLLVLFPCIYGSVSAEEYLYYRNFVWHNDGNSCTHVPPHATMTAFTGAHQDTVIIESAPRWEGGETNIDGAGTFGMEFGNLDTARVHPGDRIVVRFTCLTTGEQGTLVDTIPEIPWTRFPRTLVLKSVDLPPRPDSVKSELADDGNIRVTWHGQSGYQYEVYRNESGDTLQDGRNRERYHRVAQGLTGTVYYDTSQSADTTDRYLVYARDFSGVRSAHSRVGKWPDEILDEVPRPILPSRPDLVQMYDKCWLLGLENTHRGAPGSDFVDWYIDEAFDNRYFQWDICFAMAWAKYSQGTLPNIESLDNFYRHQHPDGAISGVIREWSGEDDQPEDSPWFTRNNLFSWAEWEYYQTTGDSSRFNRVVPVLSDYAEWVRKNRRHPNGHYYWSGWSSGMDNSPRSVPDQFYPPYSWVDYDANEALAAYYLMKMAEVIGDSSTTREYRAFHDTMKTLVNRDMWSSEDQIYWDLDMDGSYMKTKTVASFWPMWARITDSVHVEGLINHLNDPRSFNRPHRVPSLAADEPEYNPNGGYWRGGVWAPTNHMIVEGLMANDKYALAREIVVNHLNNMSAVFSRTNTVWENYAPESSAPGDPARPDFVGWSAVGPIAQLIENYIGITLHVPKNKVRWNLLTTEEVGLRNLDFGDEIIREIRASARASLDDPVEIFVNTTASFQLVLFNGTDTTHHQITPGSNTVVVSVKKEPQQQPELFILFQNSPNPFNRQTNITFMLPEERTVQLRIYNVKGQLIQILVNERLERGKHVYRWDGQCNTGETVGGGIYFAVLTSKNQTATQKMLLLK